MYIIARDGSGDFTSVQGAVDAAPSASRVPVILLVREGVYRERVIVNKDNLRIIGENAERTVITASACARDLNAEGKPKGTFLSATLLVTGCNVEVENLTIRNDAGDGDAVGQAVAVYAAGDRGVWRGVRMIAAQDTLFCGPTMPKVARDALPRVIPEGVESVGDCPVVPGRQYFEDCHIQGDVDFIFGPYRCWFERCTLFMNARGGWYTAANTPEAAPHGMVFRRCRLTGAGAPGAAYLGRPWRPFARTVVLDCEMDACVSPQGFADWEGGAPVTERYGEYGTTGERADLSARHPGEKRLAAEEAALITPAEVIGGFDGFDPTRRTPSWFLCGDSTMCDYKPELAPRTGWGQALRALVVGAHVQNCASSGRSSKSFIDERRLEVIVPCLRPGDLLLIQFGHNDEKPDEARATRPEDTYPAYLSQYIDAALAHGAQPVLLTSIARRHFDERGELLSTHGAYPDAMRALAKRRGVPLIDMERETEALLRALGPEGSKALFNWQRPGHPHYPDGVQDDTHLCLTGAVRLAQLALSQLRSALGT